MAIKRQFSYWTDAYGRTRLTTFNHDPAVSGLMISNQLVAASNGGISSYVDDTVNSLVPLPIIGIYQGVMDSALLLFQDTAGNNVKIYVPAPAITIFAPDTVTVDPTNVDVAAIITAVLASGRSSAGLPISSYLGGVYEWGGKILQNG